MTQDPSDIEVPLAAANRDVIAGRYRVIQPIGKGAQGHTFLARDEESSDLVALKEVNFEGLGNWDAVETFERESKVLGGLDHVSVPRMRETFRLEVGDALRLIMVQDFVEGENLETLLQSGGLFDEERLRGYAAELLDVLSYLHAHSPPVLHRDIKPANIVERPDGSIALVDFGAAQGHGSMTEVIGTSGYMPPEQLMGRAVPASDLYGLGATLVHLATRRHPTELRDGLELDWRKYSSLSEEFSSWLDACVAPMAEDRHPTAHAARAALLTRGGDPASHGPGAAGARAPGSSAQLVLARPSECPFELTVSGEAIDARVGSTEAISEPGKLFGMSAITGIAAVVLLTVFGVNGLVALGSVALGLVLLAWWLFRNPTFRFECKPNGLTLYKRRSGVVKRLPLDKVDGFSQGANNDAYLLVVHTRDGEQHELARSRRRADIVWLESVVRRWLVEQRMK